MPLDPFVVVVAPTADLVQRKMTVPQTFYAPTIITPLAYGNEGSSSCQAMPAEKARQVAQALRDLAYHIEHMHAIPPGLNLPSTSRRRR